METQTENKMIPQLKDSVATEMMKPENRTKLGELIGVSSQSIRLWIIKKDIRLLSFPVMKHIATQMQCNIDELIK